MVKHTKNTNSAKFIQNPDSKIYSWILHDADGHTQPLKYREKKILDVLSITSAPLKRTDIALAAFADPDYKIENFLRNLHRTGLLHRFTHIDGQRDIYYVSNLNDDVMALATDPQSLYVPYTAPKDRPAQMRNAPPLVIAPDIPKAERNRALYAFQLGNRNPERFKHMPGEKLWVYTRPPTLLPYRLMSHSNLNTEFLQLNLNYCKGSRKHPYTLSMIDGRTYTLSGAQGSMLKALLETPIPMTLKAIENQSDFRGASTVLASLPDDLDLIHCVKKPYGVVNHFIAYHPEDHQRAALAPDLNFQPSAIESRGPRKKNTPLISVFDSTSLQISFHPKSRHITPLYRYPKDKQGNVIKPSESDFQRATLIKDGLVYPAAGPKVYVGPDWGTAVKAAPADGNDDTADMPDMLPIMES